MTKISAMTTDTSIAGTEKLVSLDGTTNGVILVSAISTYAIADLLDSTQITSLSAADEFIIERGGSAYTVDVQYITSYILDDVFNSTDGETAASGDLVLVERAGDLKTLDVDDIKTYVTPTLASLLDISAQDDATLASGSLFLIGAGSSLTEATLAELETKLWADFDTYTTGLDAVETLAATDAFYVLDNGTPQKILASTIATYMTTASATGIIAASYDVDAVTSLTSGDEFTIENGDTPKTATINNIDAYVQTSIAADIDTPITAFAATDEILVERDAGISKIDVDGLNTYVMTNAFSATSITTTATTLTASEFVHIGSVSAAKKITWENFADGIQSRVLDISTGFTAPTLDGTDGILIDEAGTPKRTTLTALETKLWADLDTYVTGLGAVATLAASDAFYILDNGTPQKILASTIATYVESAISTNVVADVFDGTAADPLVTGDLVGIERSGTLYSAKVDVFADYSIATLGAKDALTPLLATDDLPVYRSSTAYLTGMDDIATFAVASIWDSDTAESSLTGDMFHFERGDTSYQIDIDDMQTYINTGLATTTLSLAGLDTATLSDTDELLVAEGAVGKVVLYSALKADIYTEFHTALNALADISALADDDVLYVSDDATTAKKTTAKEIATYVDDEIWEGAVALTTATMAGTDKFAMRTGTDTKYCTFTTLASEISDEIESGLLDVSSLGDATLSDGDYLLVGESTTAKKSTVGGLSTYVLGGIDTYVAALDPVGTTTDTDTFYCIQSTEKELTALKLAEYCYAYTVTTLAALDAKTTPVVGDYVYIEDSESSNALKRIAIDDIVTLATSSTTVNNWYELSSTKWTSTPLSTSSITMSDTSDMEVGLPLKYTNAVGTYYGIVTAVTASTSITIAGGTLASNEITNLYVGQASQVEQVEFFIEWPYGDAIQDCLAEVAEKSYKWQKADANLVFFSAAHHWADSTAQPNINVKIGTGLVSTHQTNEGITMLAADTWADNSAIAIDTDNYKVERGDAIEIRCTATGTDGDAEGLTVSCVFVTE